MAETERALSIEPDSESSGHSQELTIRHYTTQLSQPHWFIPLVGLLEIFEDVPVDDEQDSMGAELQVILSDLYLLSQDMPMASGRLLMRLTKRLSVLTIWAYRVSTVQTPREHWNPLKETYRSFSKGRETICHIQQDSYPATDIIRTWLQETLSGH